MNFRAGPLTGRGPSFTRELGAFRHVYCLVAMLRQIKPWQGDMLSSIPDSHRRVKAKRAKHHIATPTADVSSGKCGAGADRAPHCRHYGVGNPGEHGGEETPSTGTVTLQSCATRASIAQPMCPRGCGTVCIAWLAGSHLTGMHWNKKGAPFFYETSVHCEESQRQHLL